MALRTVTVLGSTGSVGVSTFDLLAANPDAYQVRALVGGRNARRLAEQAVRLFPVLADVRPSGRYLMSELVAIGGIQPLMKRMLDAKLLHLD